MEHIVESVKTIGASTFFIYVPLEFGSYSHDQPPLQSIIQLQRQHRLRA